MIRINIDEGDIPKSILTALKQAETALKRKKTAVSRKTYISNQDIWGKIKPTLEEFSYFKCWYTEAFESSSYYAVDHFRPKGAVVLEPTHSIYQNTTIPNDLIDNGYWWLTYDWKNYRISSGMPNTGTKQNFFPIKQGSSFWHPHNTNNLEAPLLLDPLNSDDFKLLMFDSDGKAKPTIEPSVDPIENIKNIRALISIKVYGLNSNLKIINARKKEWAETYRLSILYNKFHERLKAPFQDADVVILLNESKHIIKEMIQTKIKPSAQFSRVNICCLKSTMFEWVDNIILP